MMINIQEDKLVSASDAEEFHRFHGGQAIDWDLLQEANAVLTREAHLLDIGAYNAWLTHCVAQEVQYQVVSRELRAASERRYQLNDAVNIYNDNYQQLKVRVEHQLDPQNWGNSPKVRYTRYITNVLVARDKDDLDLLHIRSNVIVQRARRGNQADLFHATREDIWRRHGDGHLKLMKRFIDYPERVLQTHNLMLFI
ncbi:aromatic-ring-hydroxylating dioxygenase subunit beta [Pseudomonas sp. NY15437]|uniref:aromatic-ring-hydroxylating dioxygenase subunit beta n=1 Tax=Pseudomonas sp. NY15437 TaxID=3400360 RepID=UPI003A85AFB5